MIWTVGRKILLGYGVGLVLLGLVAGISYWAVTRLVDNFSEVVRTQKVVETLSMLLSRVKDAETGQRGFLLTGEESYLKPYRDAVAEIPHLLAELQGKVQLQDELPRLKKLIDEKMDELKDTIGKRRAPGGAEKAKDLVQRGEGKQAMDEIRALVKAMHEKEDRQLQRWDEDARSASSWARGLILFGTLLALVLKWGTGLYIQRSITTPLTSFAGFVERIGQGDLTQQAVITTEDEVGQLGIVLNRMVSGLRDLGRQVRSAADELGGAAGAILASTQEQAAGTRQQAASIQQISTTIEEVSQSGGQIAERARQVAAAAEATSSASTVGLQAVQAATRSMMALREQVEAVAEQIVGLSEKTQAVGEIVAAVTDLAERSNLLALNAAIEAAGAGEHGSRFAVVASEMKSLADQAKEATSQVQGILGGIQKGINRSVLLTEEAVKRAESGREQAETTERVIHQMADTTQESIQAFQQIVAATNQQQIGFDQVSQGMRDIRQAATQTAASVGQLESAVARISALSQQLQKDVGRYQL